MPLSVDALISRMTWAASHNLTEFGFTAGGCRVILRRERQALCGEPTRVSPVTEGVEQEQLGAAPVGAIESPLSGICYLAKDVGSAPFVQLGDHVEEGQTLCLVEAMKLMTSVPAPFAGRIAKICVADAVSVEAGAILFEIQK